MGEIAVQGAERSLDAALIFRVVDGSIFLCQAFGKTWRGGDLRSSFGWALLCTPCWGPGQGFRKASESPPLRQREAGLLGRGASLE